MILTLSGLLAACGAKSGSDLTEVVEPEGYIYGIQGLKAKKTYKTLIYFESAVPNLNYMETSEAADAQHFANFVDGLLAHNEFGVLEKNLAIEAKHNDDFTKFEFKIKKNVPWVMYDGTQYEATVNGVKVKQYVQPSDWVTSAKTILTAQRASSLEYFISDFVKGGAEYFYYTDLMYKIATDNTYRKKYDGKLDAQAKYINDQIKANKENAWNSWYAENPITGDDLEGIKNLSRLGIKANDEEGTLSYELIQKAFYFPTLLTYSCYLPVNKYFLDDVGWTAFGVQNDKILYNGPFLFTEEGSEQLTYSKNKLYHNPDIVNVDKIIYQVYNNTIGPDYTRTQYFKGNIDGFGLSNSDAVGWSQFVTGPDGTGTIRDPYSGDVNSRLLDTIGNMYGSNITLARTKNEGSKVSYSTKSTATSVANTEKALQLEPVRRAILNALDYDAYYCNYSTEEPLKSQYKVNTYTPKNFVQSESGDYVTNHYYNVYAAKKGIPTGTSVGNGAHMEDGELVAEEGSAAYILENGRIDRCQKSNAEVAALAAEAKKAIEAYNAGPGSADPISLPVYVEFYTPWDVDTNGTAKQYDGQTILSMNKRLNNTDSESVSDYNLFYVIPTDKVRSANMDTLSHSGAFDYAPVLWGWGADYGDPLTYANTYAIGGDWKSIFPYVGMEQVDNYFWDYENHTLGEKTNLLREYTDMVKAAAAITDDINARYNKFAECEYMLMEELSIYMPQVNNGQGWSLSISRSAGYHMPQANYGLSSDRMTGLWVLETALNRQERQAIKAKYDAAKAKYTAEHPTINIY